MSLRTVNAVGSMLACLGLYGPASRAWDWWLVRDPWLRARTSRLYEPIVRPGDTVIDVGANLGIHTRAFLDLGSLVTAYEPNPYCLDVLNNRFKNENRLRLSESGICAGTDSRMETFHVCESHGMSTFSKCEEHRPANRKWKRMTQVYTIPLDWAIDRHRDNFGSLPDYVKIDVQGMDSEIIQSLTRRPRTVSFEMFPGGISHNVCRSVLGRKFRLSMVRLFGRLAQTDRLGPGFRYMHLYQFVHQRRRRPVCEMR